MPGGCVIQSNPQPNERRANMARYSDAAPRKWLNAEVLKRILNGDRSIWLTVAGVGVEIVGTGEAAESSVVLRFVERKEKLSLNNINGDFLAGELGDDMDHWIGALVCLFVDPSVMFGGRRIDGVRISAVEKSKPAQTA